MRTVTLSRERIALKKTAVPSIFPNCPSYLSEFNSKPKRLCLDDKERLLMESAYSKSITDNEETVDKFLVNSYSDLLSKLNLIDLPNGWITNVSNNTPLFFIKIVILETGPFIDRSVLVNDDLYIKAFDNKNVTIPISRIFINDTRQVETILDEVDTFSLLLQTINSQTECSINNHIKLAIHELESAINLVDGDSIDLDIDGLHCSSESLSISFHFLVGQLRNLINAKSRRRYNILTQVFSLKIHGISPACYRLIQSSNCLILPHERNLIGIKNTLGIEGDYFQILKEITSKFSHRDRHVILQMDEVHIRSDASYKGGKVLGAIDNPSDPPTTVFSMMISSLMKKFSTIVRLIPLGSSSAADLYPIITKTIGDIESCDLFVEAICTDNYPLNVSLFKLFSYNTKILQARVVHPCNPTRNLILFFDIVHIMKSIRNNWLNLKDFEKTFIYPDFETCTDDIPLPVILPFTQLKVSIPVANILLDPRELTKSKYPPICFAAFDDLRTLFKADKFSIIKRAPKLTSKACWPSHLERQNVNLALKIFHESTAAGLSSFYNENTTNENRHIVKFILLINKIWNIFNVNWVGKDIRFNNPNFAPLRLNDPRLSFLDHVVKWLDCWKLLPTSRGKLTPQTFTSFRHTCIALPLLVQRLTLECGFEYLLTSRIQNDPLEHHFGLYRQMSGSNYNISYCQILESERRLQLSNLLNFFNINQQSDKISLKEYLKSFTQEDDAEMHPEFDCEYVTSEILNIANPLFDNSQIECLNYVAGYAIFSYLKNSKECRDCKDFLTSPKDIQVINDTGFSMIEFLDRGSLKYPSEIIYQSLIIMYEIFLKIDNHSHLSKLFYEGSCRRNLVQLSLIIVEEKYSEIWRQWCVCMVPKWEILKKIYTTVANCILAKKVRNFNSIVIGRDNSKLKKFSTQFF